MKDFLFNTEDNTFIIPEGYKFMELRASSQRNEFQKSIVLTSPRVDFLIQQ